MKRQQNIGEIFIRNKGNTEAMKPRCFLEEKRIV